MREEESREGVNGRRCGLIAVKMSKQAFAATTPEVDSGLHICGVCHFLLY